MQVSSRWPFLPITPSHEQFQCCCRHGMGAEDYAWGCLDAQLIFVLAVCTTVSIFLIFMMNGNSVEENKSWHSSCVGAHWSSHVMLVMRVRYCSILQASAVFLSVSTTCCKRQTCGRDIRVYTYNQIFLCNRMCHQRFLFTTMLATMQLY